MKLYEVIALLALIAAVLSSRRSPLCKAAALVGLLVSSAVIRRLLSSGTLPVRVLLTGLGTLAISAAFWADYRKGLNSTGLLIVCTLLFGLLPLAGLLRVLVFRPDQIPHMRENLLISLFVFPSGVSCGICLIQTLRRKA